MSKQEKGGSKKQQKPPQKAANSGSQKSNKQRDDGNEDVKRDQKLQAVVLADNFLDNFNPITDDCPVILMPLSNIPIIEYTFELLVQGGVEEIILFCSNHGDAIQKYIKNSHWDSIISVKVIFSPGCTSAGDALREIDTLNLIRSDPFVFIDGNVIGNLNLKEMIAYHKLKRKEDMNCVMTMIFKRIRELSNTAAVTEDLTLVLNKSGQLFYFNDSLTDSIKLSGELFSEQEDLQVKFNLLDCGVYICSPEFLLQFSDNFDYQDIRKDFIQNEVGNWALGKHIFGYLLENEYATKITDLHSYNAVSNDLVACWAYPLVPNLRPFDTLGDVTTALKQTKADKKKKTLHRLPAGVVLADNVSLSTSVSLSHCVIGKNSVIGDNVHITNSHIWKDVRVEADARITDSVICDKVVIGQGAVISRGCVVASGVIVAKYVLIPEFTRVSWINGAIHMETVASGDLTVATSLLAASIGCRELEASKKTVWSELFPPEEDDDDDEFDEDMADLQPGTDGVDENFKQMIVDLVLTGRNDPAESLLMEIKGSKFAHNKSFANCVEGVVPALLQICFESANAAGTFSLPTFRTALIGQIKKTGWGYALLRAVVFEALEEYQLICAVESFLLSVRLDANLSPVFRLILQELHADSCELLTDEGIEEWIDSRRDPTSDDSAEVKKLFESPLVQQFVEWCEAEDESEEEEEGDDDDDEDSDEESD